MPTGQQKLLLIMMLGLPGSGKSYFADRLAADQGFIHLSSDAMRLAIFKSREVTDAIYNSKDKSVLNTYTFGALNYATVAALKSGVSVVYDANNNSVKERYEIAKIGSVGSVVPVVVWIKVPQEVAIQRMKDRSETSVQRQLSSEMAQSYAAKMSQEIEHPGNDENFIAIDGTVPFSQQLNAFQQQLQRIAS